MEQEQLELFEPTAEQYAEMLKNKYPEIVLHLIEEQEWFGA